MKYFFEGKFNPKDFHPLNVDVQSIALVPAKSRVLEIGCADGFLGEYLKKEKKCEVLGVEIDAEAVKKATSRTIEAICGDVENEKIVKKIDNLGKFDVVLALAVIEHLKDPKKALQKWQNFLKKDGRLIISTSNIANWSARLKILHGNFTYEDYGLFDRTHLHFFTLNSFKKLIEESGYLIKDLKIDPVGGGMPKVSLILAKFMPNLFAYQMVIKAKIANKL